MELAAGIYIVEMRQKAVPLSSQKTTRGERGAIRTMLERLYGKVSNNRKVI